MSYDEACGRWPVPARISMGMGTRRLSALCDGSKKHLVHDAVHLIQSLAIESAVAGHHRHVPNRRGPSDATQTLDRNQH